MCFRAYDHFPVKGKLIIPPAPGFATPVRYRIRNPRNHRKPVSLITVSLGGGAPSRRQSARPIWGIEAWRETRWCPTVNLSKTNRAAKARWTGSGRSNAAECPISNAYRTSKQRVRNDLQATHGGIKQPVCPHSPSSNPASDHGRRGEAVGLRPGIPRPPTGPGEKSEFCRHGPSRSSRCRRVWPFSMRIAERRCTYACKPIREPA